MTRRFVVFGVLPKCYHRYVRERQRLIVLLTRLSGIQDTIASERGSQHFERS